MREAKTDAGQEGAWLCGNGEASWERRTRAWRGDSGEGPGGAGSRCSAEGMIIEIHSSVVGFDGTTRLGRCVTRRVKSRFQTCVLPAGSGAGSGRQGPVRLRAGRIVRIGRKRSFRFRPVGPSLWKERPGLCSFFGVERTGPLDHGPVRYDQTSRVAKRCRQINAANSPDLLRIGLDGPAGVRHGPS